MRLTYWRRVWTYDFAQQLLNRPDRTVRAWVVGRLVIIWDTKGTS